MRQLEQQQCGLCGVHQDNLFCGLSSEFRERLELGSTVQTFRKGQTVFQQGSPAFAVHCLRSGRLKLFKTTRRGDRQVLRLLGAGDIVGFRALLAEEPYAASAEALTETTACLIPRPILTEMLRESPDFGMQVMAKLAVELRISEDQLLSMVHHTVKERAAALLLSLIEIPPGTTPNGEFPLTRLRRGELAQIIGTTPESFSRTLRHFADRNLIRLDRTDIVITNRTALELIAAG